MAQNLAKLLTKAGTTTFAEASKAPVLAYYFSAHWCPPCKKFTPLLAENYTKWNAAGKQIEIVFCSFDKNETEFKQYFSTMPWTALPYGDPKIQELAQKFEVQGIPNLCFVSKDGKDELLSSNGYEDLMFTREKAIDTWKKLY